MCTIDISLRRGVLKRHKLRQMPILVLLYWYICLCVCISVKMSINDVQRKPS